MPPYGGFLAILFHPNDILQIQTDVPLFRGRLLAGAVAEVDVEVEHVRSGDFPVAGKLKPAALHRAGQPARAYCAIRTRP